MTDYYFKFPSNFQEILIDQEHLFTKPLYTKVKATDFNGRWNTRSVHGWNGKPNVLKKKKKDKRGEKFSSGLIDRAGSVGG